MGKDKEHETESLYCQLTIGTDHCSKDIALQNEGRKITPLQKTKERKKVKELFKKGDKKTRPISCFQTDSMTGKKCHSQVQNTIFKRKFP
jgi:hypothetical protein